jgi:retron-type reverse transcriptase
LKFDVKKFYENIDHNTLKTLLRRKFKDNDLLELLNSVINSTDGIPLGNFISQFLANFYLTGFDHWVKEVEKIKYYYRYMDDIVILGHNKEELRVLFKKMEGYLHSKLNLEIKSTYQIYPINSRGIDFVGYKHYTTHTLLRKSIKKRFISMVRHRYSYKSLASYDGWIKHCNGINLFNKYVKNNNRKEEVQGAV